MWNKKNKATGVSPANFRTSGLVFKSTKEQKVQVLSTEYRLFDRNYYIVPKRLLNTLNKILRIKFKTSKKNIK